MNLYTSTKYSWTMEREEKEEDEKDNKDDDDNDVLYPLTSDLWYIKADLTSTIPTNTIATTKKTTNTTLRETVDFTPPPDELWL